MAELLTLKVYPITFKKKKLEDFSFLALFKCEGKNHNIE